MVVGGGPIFFTPSVQETVVSHGKNPYFDLETQSCPVGCFLPWVFSSRPFSLSPPFCLFWFAFLRNMGRDLGHRLFVSLGFEFTPAFQKRLSSPPCQCLPSPSFLCCFPRETPPLFSKRWFPVPNRTGLSCPVGSPTFPLSHPNHQPHDVGGPEEAPFSLVI